MAAPAPLVYVIDDDSTLRAAYSAALIALGYRVKTAGDGVEGQALMATGVPDLILLDMLMPNLDGKGFLIAVRSNPAYQAIKVVVVSNFESAPEVEQLGIAKYLSKMQSPPDAVAAAVDRLVRAG